MKEANQQIQSMRRASTSTTCEAATINIGKTRNTLVKIRDKLESLDYSQPDSDSNRINPGFPESSRGT
jgi:hypothetical protein